jgi:hypothetical protein
MTTRTFDPSEIAAEALSKGEDPVAVVVGQLAGYASTCWENMSGTGIFQSEDARDAVDATLAWLRSTTVARVEPGERLVLLTKSGLSEAEVDALVRWAAGEQRLLVIDSAMVQGVYVMDAGAEPPVVNTDEAREDGS